VLLLSVIAFLYGRPDFLDLALAYALINFIGVLAVLVNAFMMFDNILLAFLGAAFGTVIWRVYCEIMIVLFRMLDVLTDIRNERNPPAG